MTDYTKLVEDLRDIKKTMFALGTSPINMYNVSIRLAYDKKWGRTAFDAAAAIEALQAEVERLQADVEKWTFNATLEQSKAIANFESYCKLKAQLPKRGEWIEDDKTYAGGGMSNYKCSLCGKIGGTWRRGLKPSELPNWCGNCGADMRKMEVQE